jgi:hypothetical protein
MRKFNKIPAGNASAESATLNKKINTEMKNRPPFSQPAPDMLCLSARDQIPEWSTAYENMQMTS